MPSFLRYLSCLLAAAALVGCQQRPADGAASAGPVTFVDAAGNRMVVDVPVDASAAAPAREAWVDSATTAQAVLSDGTAPGSSTAIPAATLDATTYVDVEDLERQVLERNKERFYLLPDGTGGQQVVTAGAIDLSTGARTPAYTVTPGPRATPIACPASAPLAHLLPADERHRQYSLQFPVTDPEFAGRRYAGYSIAVPDGVRLARVMAIVRGGLSADVAVVLADQAGVALAVVNNIATESIPESAFRYAMVGANVPLDTSPGRRLVVLEGPWARKVLPQVCRPAERPATSVTGKVSVEFLLEGLKTP